MTKQKSVKGGLCFVIQSFGHSSLIRHSSFLIRHFGQMLWAGVVLTVVVEGCAKTHPTPPSPVAQQNAPPQVASDVTLRMQTLGRLADSFARLSNQLPGESVADHRKLMSQAFAQLEEILPMLEGSGSGAEFRQQLQVISDAQAELATGPQGLSPEPTIDTGLRAARDALSGIAHAPYYDQAELTPLFDQLAAKLDDLDKVRGPLHQVEVGEAVAISSQIITRMSHVLGQRLIEQNAPGQSATQPVSIRDE